METLSFESNGHDIGRVKLYLCSRLEDFLHFLVPAGDDLWTLAEEVTQKVEIQECCFRPTYRSKAKIYAWLSWQEEPGKPLGKAITARYFNADAPHAQKLMSWVCQLFNLT